MAERLDDEVQVVYKNPKPLFGIIKRRQKYDENGRLIYYKKKGGQVSAFFVGCAVFVVFALLLESLVHNLVLKGLPVGEKILGNTLLYALYGGLMAGLFEETGRFLAFKTVLKKRQDNDRNALMYGAGHGGIECILQGFSIR